MFVSAIRRAVQIRHDRPATICGPRVRSWAQSADRIARLAQGLRALGARPGTTVGILASNSDHYLEAIYATWWLGGVAVPMNARWALPEHAYSVDDAGIEIIFSDDGFVKMARDIARACSQIRHVVPFGDTEGFTSAEALIAAAQPQPATERCDDELAGVFYTGGTTGKPKGVMHSARSLWSTAITLYSDMGVPDCVRYLHCAPMFHLGGLTPAFATTILAGTQVFIPMFRPEFVAEAVRAHRVQFTAVVPTMLGMLVDDPAFRADDYRSLEVVQYGGGAITERVRKALTAAFPHVRMQQGFGQTETAGGATTMPHHVMQQLAPEDPRRRSAGRACYGVEVKVVDPAHVRLPPGVVGELCLKTPGAMLGYLNKPEQTAQALIDGWVHTGDAGYLDEDGYVFVCDRLKDVIRTGGENVFSAEVESAVAAHPSVVAVAAIAVPDEIWGERVHAVVTLRDGTALELEQLQKHCRALIAGYKIPRSMEVRAELPLSPQGKVLKSELRKPYWEGLGRNIG